MIRQAVIQAVHFQVCHKHLNFKTKISHASSNIRSAVSPPTKAGNVDINNFFLKKQRLNSWTFFYCSKQVGGLQVVTASSGVKKQKEKVWWRAVEENKLPATHQRKMLSWDQLGMHVQQAWSFMWGDDWGYNDGLWGIAMLWGWQHQQQNQIPEVLHQTAGL